MGSPAQKKYLRAHKITNALFLILLVPFLIVSLLAAIIMFNTKSAGGYANFLGYYVYEIQNDNFKKSTDMIRYDDDPYVKGAKFLFHKVSVDDLKDDQFVIYYSKAGTDTPTASTEPNWVYMNSRVIPSGVQIVGEEQESGLAEMKLVQLAGKKATITTEDGNKHVVLSYYTSVVERGFDWDNTDPGDELLVYDNIVGVMAEDQNAFLMGLLEFCGSTSGFLILVLGPCGLLLMLKLISLAFYRRWAHEEELIRDTEIMASDKVSYHQALRGARKSRIAQSERIASSTRGASAAAPKQAAKPQSSNASKRGSTVPKSATIQRTAPKPRAQAATQPAPQTQQKPVQRAAPKPRTPKTSK